MSDNPYQSSEIGESQQGSVSDEGESRKHHVDAVHFVHHALKHAMRDTELQQDGRVTAQGLCRILLELAVDEFGAEGANVLMQWNVMTGSDVGLIVRRMQRAEIEEANSINSEAGFDGLFDLREPPESWALTW